MYNITNLNDVKSYVDACFTKVASKNVDISAIKRNALDDAINSIVVADGFDLTPDLRQFPNIESGLTDNCIRMIFVKGFQNTLTIGVINPSDSTAYVDFGDGDKRYFSTSTTQQTLTKTYTSFLTSTDNESYRIIEIKGAITDLQFTQTTNLPNVFWFCGKSTSLLNLAMTNRTNTNRSVFYCLRRFVLNAPNCELNRYAFINSNLIYFDSNVKMPSYNSGDLSSLFQYSLIEKLKITLPTSTNNNFSNLISYNPNLYELEINVANPESNYFNCGNLCRQNYNLRKFKTNICLGSFDYAFNTCRKLKEVDFSAGLVSGISTFLYNTNCTMLEKLLFPSYVDTDGIRKPRPLWSNFTTGPTVDIQTCGMSREALVEMFRSLPVCTSGTPAVNITGSLGAAALTADDLLIGTSKGYIITR